MKPHNRLLNWLWRAGRYTVAERLFRLGGRAALDGVLRAGQRSAVDTAVSAAAGVLPISAQQAYTQVFNAQPPLTVYVNASHCRVTVQRHDAPKVILEASMVRAFGLTFVTDQDDAGVYIVAKRKPVTGAFSRADFSITVPVDCHLVFRLTPGDVVLHNIDGTLELPALPPTVSTEREAD